MNGLTPDRVTRIGAWRNSTVRSLRAVLGKSLTSRDRAPEILDPAQRRAPDALVRTVESEVVPSLLRARRSADAAATLLDFAAFVSAAEVAEFAEMIVAQQAPDLFSRIGAMRTRGVSLESVYVQLLIPAARRLCAQWEDDRCHFEEIALGMLNLQQVLGALRADSSTEVPCRASGLKVLLLSAPGEQSMLGVFMVTDFHRCVTAEFFQRAGWDVWRGLPGSRSATADLLRSQWFDAIDVSSSCEARLPGLAVDVEAMRKASRNPRITITVSGPAFVNHPEYAARAKADACSGDPRDTLVRVEALVARRERECSTGVDSVADIPVCQT